MNLTSPVSTGRNLHVCWVLVSTVGIPEGVWQKQRLIGLIGRQQERSSCLVPVLMKDGTEALPDRLWPALISHWYYTYTCSVTPKIGKKSQRPSQSCRGVTALYRVSNRSCFDLAMGATHRCSHVVFQVFVSCTWATFCLLKCLVFVTKTFALATSQKKCHSLLLVSMDLVPNGLRQLYCCLLWFSYGQMYLANTLSFTYPLWKIMEAKYE